jgi:Uncharacterized protein conserved in bacteria
MKKTDLDMISEYISENHVISFCCFAEDDIWAANSFYIFNKDDVCFYLMSDPNTRHGRLAIANPVVAGTINEQPSNILSIKGLQYKGVMALLADGVERQLAYQTYTQRFPVAKIKSLPLWKIEIQEMKFTNNSLGFGKKISWERP